ncbi:hypothetical protein [Azospirillum himalayense]|uniref:Uncharacterized protein n=1 Tax=Azospirillum himalayense TaxID=654847 RepID=A0ABW0GDA1_9PROT
MAGGILGLDLGRTMGWAVADRPAIDVWPPGPFLIGRTPPRPKIHSGSHVIGPSGMEHGRYFLAYDNWLYEMLEWFKPKAVAVEAAIVTGKGGNSRRGEGIEAIRRLVGKETVTKLRCADMGLTYVSFHNATVKKQFAGNGRADEQEMLRAFLARAWGNGAVWADHNEVDGSAVLECGVRVLKHGETL